MSSSNPAAKRVRLFIPSNSYSAKVGKIYFLNAVVSIKSIRLLNDCGYLRISTWLQTLTSSFDFLISIAVIKIGVSYNLISAHKSKTAIQRLPSRASIQVFKPRKKLCYGRITLLVTANKKGLRTKQLSSKVLKGHGNCGS